MRKYKTLSCEPSPGGVLDGNESEGPPLVLGLVYNKHRTETCSYWFDLLMTEPDGPAPACVLLTQRKMLSAGVPRSELALAAGEQDSSLRSGNLQLQKFLSQSKSTAASKAQFGRSSRPVLSSREEPSLGH